MQDTCIKYLVMLVFQNWKKKAIMKVKCPLNLQIKFLTLASKLCIIWPHIFPLCYSALVRPLDLPSWTSTSVWCGPLSAPSAGVTGPLWIRLSSLQWRHSFMSFVSFLQPPGLYDPLEEPLIFFYMCLPFLSDEHFGLHLTMTYLWTLYFCSYYLSPTSRHKILLPQNCSRFSNSLKFPPISFSVN